MENRHHHSVITGSRSLYQAQSVDRIHSSKIRVKAICPGSRLTNSRLQEGEYTYIELSKHEMSSPSLWDSSLEQLLCSVPLSLFDSSLRSHDDLTTKAERIDSCLSQKPVDMWALRELALSNGGLLTPLFRQKAWPLLVGVHGDSPSSTQPIVPDRRKSSTDKNINNNDILRRSPGLAHTDTKPPAKFSFETSDTSTEEKKTESFQESSLDLIRRDVGRSVVFRYNDRQHPRATPSYASERLAQALEDTIRSSASSTLRTYHYYQGLHDVAGVVLHQLDYQADLGSNILTRLAQSHWRDALRENFGNLTWILNHLFLPLLQKAEPVVHYQLQITQLEMSNLILPWMITWFTHDIFDADTAARVVDGFMASHPLLCLYFSVALLTHPRLKSDIMQADPNDPASLFVALKQLPKSIVSDNTFTPVGDKRVKVQELLDDALALLQKHPPRSLLNLVDEKVLPRSAVLQRASSISMFQAVRSWTLTSPAFSPIGPLSSSYTRAKLASGVPLLIATVGSDWARHRQAIRQRRLEESGKRPRTKLQKLQHMIRGK